MIVLYVISTNTSFIERLIKSTSSIYYETAIRIDVQIITHPSQLACDSALALIWDVEHTTYQTTPTVIKEVPLTLPILLLTRCSPPIPKKDQQGVHTYITHTTSLRVVSLKLVKLVLQYQQAQTHITLGTRTDMRYLPIQTVLYLKADDHSVDVYTSNQQVVTVFTALKQVEKQLNPPFFRVHRSYLINAMYLNRIQPTKKQIALQGVSVPIPVSTKYLPQLCAIKTWLQYRRR